MGLESLVYRVGADIKDFVRNMDKVERTLQRSLGQDALNLSQGLVTGLAGLGAAMGGLGAVGVKLAADMEQNRIAFTTMLGSAERAQTFLEEMATFAAETPFELPGLLDSSKKLLAFGFTAEQIRPMLTAVGDAVAGLGGGSAEIDRVTLALGQMQAKGKVSAEEMNQLAELGVPAWRLLSEQIGVSIPEAMKMAERGAISSAQAIPALLEGMANQFGGMMEKQSGTLAGLFSTAKDNISAILRALGEDLVQTFDLKTKLAGGTKWLGDFAKEVEKSGVRQALVKMIPENLRNNIIIVAGAITGAMVPALIRMGVAAAAAMVPLLPFIVAGAAIAGLGLLIAKNWENPIVQFGTAVLVLGGLALAMTSAKVATVAWTVVTKIQTVAQWALNAAMNANPIGIIITLIGLLILAGVALYKNWDTVKRIALNAWGSMKATIYSAIAAIMELYAKFIGVFSEERAAAARKAAEVARQQAQAERDAIEDRNDAVDRSAAYTEYAEQRKADAAAHAADESTAAWDDAAIKEMAAAGAVVETKKAYLEEFKTAYDRAQDAALEAFDRAQEDETTALERAQDDRLDKIKESQQQEMANLKAHHAERLDALEAELKEEGRQYERAQDDRLETLRDQLEDEKEAFSRVQEDKLGAFKAAQAEEVNALTRRHKAELDALEEAYDAQIRNLEAQQRQIDLDEKREERAKRLEGANTKVTRAQEELNAARASGDSARIIAAEMALAAAVADQQRTVADAKRDEAKESIKAQIDALKDEKSARVDALKEQQAGELEQLRERQALSLTERKRELEDEATHFGRLQEQRLTAFKRQLEDEGVAFEQQQAQRKEQLKQALAEEEAQLEKLHETILTAVKRLDEDERTEWSRQQGDRRTQYKQELEDLEASFENKLGAQTAFIRDWNASVEKMKAMAPTASGLPGTPAVSGSAGTELPKFAAGTVAFKATAGIFGERGPEAIMPLSWLRERLVEFGQSIAAGVTGLSSRFASFAASALPAAAGAMGDLRADGGGQSGQPVQNIYQFAPGSVVIPAKDLAEMREIQEFFDLFPQVARAMGL